MSMQSHIAELVRRHAALEREIESAQGHPGVDSLELAELKRKKLQLKEEIERLKQPTVLH